MLTISPFHTLSRRAERLRRTPWLDVIRTAWLVLLGGIFIKAILPAPLANTLRPLLLLAPLLVLVAKDLSHLPDALQRSRTAMRMRAWRQLPAAWLPPELVGLFRLDRALRRGCLNWLRRRPQPPAPAGRGCAYLEQGSYRTAVAIVLVSTFIELPLHAAVLPLFVHDAGTLHVMAPGYAGGSPVDAGLAVRRPLAGRGRPSRADGGGPAAARRRPHPRPGAAGGDRALRNASRRARRGRCRRRNGIEPRSAVRATPLDKPNLVLILEKDSPVCL